jgi:hypothetical protein
MKRWVLENSFNFKGREVRWGVKGQGDAVIMAHGTH